MPCLQQTSVQGSLCIASGGSTIASHTIILHPPIRAWTQSSNLLKSRQSMPFIIAFPWAYNPTEGMLNMTKPSASQLCHVYRSYPLYQNCQSFKVVKLIRSIHQPYLQEMLRGPMISKSPAYLQNYRDLPSSESLTVDLDKNGCGSAKYRRA